LARKNPNSSVWEDGAPVRAELFGAERLEHHAQSLAEAQRIITGRPLRVLPLRRRVKENADVLLQAYRTCAEACSPAR
jgi:cyclic beta-1,2-glucan synthetase